MKVSVTQMNAGDNRGANLEQAERLVRAAAERHRTRLVALPESFVFIGGTLERRRAAAERVPTGPACDPLGRLVRQHGFHLHGGSLIEKEGDRSCNTSMVFSPSGEIIAKYRKIHLFDVTTLDAASYRESASVDRGSEIVRYRADDLELGSSICYDLRFGELYLALAKRDAQAMLSPAALTLQTGKDHWEVPCRAGAIETQSHVIAGTGRFLHGRWRDPLVIRAFHDRRPMGFRCRPLFRRDRMGDGRARQVFTSNPRADS